MDAPAPEASPAKPVLDALATLHEEFHTAVQIYTARIDEDLARVQKAVKAESTRKKFSPAKLRDLRDMFTILRKASIKPGKGRRKDLKKIDALVEDLTMLVEHWK